MKRRGSPVIVIATFAVVAIVVVGLQLGPGAEATLDGDVFTSRDANVRMVVPRGWRVSDLPNYPGVLLWMVRTSPPGVMLLTVDTIDRDLRCSWPPRCRAAGTPLADQVACGLAARLGETGFRVGEVQPGRAPWFDYEDDRRWLRQAVLVAGRSAVTLILSAQSAADRSSQARAFDRALRSLRPLTASEAAAAAVAEAARDAGVAAAGDGGAVAPADTGPSDAGVGDAGIGDAGAGSAPASPPPDAGIPETEAPCPAP